MQTQHAVAWLDHREAKLFFLNREEVGSVRIRTTPIGKESGTLNGKTVVGNQLFYHDVTVALKPAKEWLIMGPGSAKDELAKHIRAHHRQLENRIIGVEPADHPTDAQIVAYARMFFRAADRMLSGLHLD